MTDSAAKRTKRYEVKTTEEAGIETWARKPFHVVLTGAAGEREEADEGGSVWGSYDTLDEAQAEASALNVGLATAATHTWVPDSGEIFDFVGPGHWEPKGTR